MSRLRLHNGEWVYCNVAIKHKIIVLIAGQICLGF